MANSVVRFCTDATYRSIALVRLTKSRELHQTTVFTGMDRYPDIFKACKDYFRSQLEPKVLSFGCSTGEEVLTLRQYFPDAWITGADINKRNLSHCRKLVVDSRINFVHSDLATIQKHGPFDAIFCMAVLQRTPHTIEAR